MKNKKTVFTALLMICLVSLLIIGEGYISSDYFLLLILIAVFLPLLIEVIPIVVSKANLLFPWLFIGLFLLSLLLFWRDYKIWGFVFGVGALFLYKTRLHSSQSKVNSLAITALMCFAFAIGYLLHFLR